MAELSTELRKRIEGVDWYHEFDFGNGVVTRPKHNFRDLWERTESFLGRLDFTGKRVLDIGCWDGYWSFFAERRGAASVLATDLNSQRWSRLESGSLRTAEVADNEGFRIAHEVYGSKIAYRGDVSAYDVAALGQRFDIVLFLGVYYHLTHPMYAITQVRHALLPGGEMVIEGGAIDDLDRSYLEFYYGYEGPEPYRADPSNWVVPTRRCLRDMVCANYFEILDEDFLPHPLPPPPPLSAANRIGRRLVTSVGTLLGLEVKAPAPPTPTPYGRALIRARAVERVDERHFFAPQLGLSRYDPRYNTAP
jgi:tRNA (mo5U34)-methyltransferase